MDNNYLKSSPIETTAELASIAIQAVPIVGGVISGIVTEVIKVRQNKRLNSFLQELANDLQSIQQSLDLTKLESEEVQNVIEDIISKASECRQQEKLNAFRALLINAMLMKNLKYDEVLEISDLINTWHDRHIIMLRILNNPKKADIEASNIVGEGSSGGFSTTSINYILKKLLPNWNEDQIYRTWQELYDSRIHRTDGVKAMMTDRGIYQLENRLTEFGKVVADYLTNPTY